MKYTIDDVAREAGVSITTVSRVLNSNYPVKKETRAKVEAAIEKLNYKPNPLARGLVGRKSFNIGVVVPGITNMFFTEVIYGIEKYVKEFGYNVLLSNTDGNPQTEQIQVKNFFERFIDGIIVLDPQTDNMKNGFYNEISTEIPLLCINGFHKDMEVNFVKSSEEKGACDAMEYLIKLGHQKIGFIRAGSSYSYDIKEAVYKKYMDSIGRDYIIIDTFEGNSIDVVNNTSRRITELNRTAMQLGEDITAFFACNDLMALGVLNGCNIVGVKVPAEVSIIGFDNIILSQMTNPKITTVDQNMRTLGATAAHQLIFLIGSDRLRCDDQIVDTTLVIRESCKGI